MSKEIKETETDEDFIQSSGELLDRQDWEKNYRFQKLAE